VVKRNGEEIEIHHDHIYTGDLIKIEYGKNIPVDGIVVSAVGL
jgi:cation transport ATPase